MKTKNLTPRNTAPVKRENVATVSTEANGIAITPQITYNLDNNNPNPFAGDDAE
jgi:prenylated cyclic peptide (anacyclamide/piricyclamide family)